MRTQIGLYGVALSEPVYVLDVCFCGFSSWSFPDIYAPVACRLTCAHAALVLIHGCTEESFAGCSSPGEQLTAWMAMTRASNISTSCLEAIPLSRNHALADTERCCYSPLRGPILQHLDGSWHSSIWQPSDVEHQPELLHRSDGETARILCWKMLSSIRLKYHENGYRVLFTNSYRGM